MQLLSTSFVVVIVICKYDANIYCYMLYKSAFALHYIWMLYIAVCCPNGTYGMNCRECAGGRVQPCNGNGQCVVSMCISFTRMS